MKIVAWLGVLDEVELIEWSVRHLQEIGVDHIIACDMYSTDGTAEILERLRSPDLWIHRLRMDQVQDEWERQALDLTQRARADWVLFVDADEFLLPVSGSIRDCADLDEADVLLIPRFNVLLGPAGPAVPKALDPSRYGEILLLDDPDSLPLRLMANDPDATYMNSRIAPRVMARRQRITGVRLGAHDVDGPELHRVAPSDLIIAHLPFTTPARFRRKVANIRRSFAAQQGDLYSGNYALHWQRWRELSEEQLEGEFERTAIEERQIARLRASGKIRSAAEILADRALDPRRS